MQDDFTQQDFDSDEEENELPAGMRLIEDLEEDEEDLGTKNVLEGETENEEPPLNLNDEFEKESSDGF